jgi:hypothetical protein
MPLPETAAVRLLAGDKEPVRVATTANITLSGLLTVDGITLEAGDRVLVKDQTDATANGIYAAAAGAWRRAPDSQTSRSLIGGMKISVFEGTAHGGDVWRLDTHRPNIGDDDIDFSLFLNTETEDAINEARETLEAEMDAIIATGLAAGKATQAEAEAGVSNVGWMTPLRTAQNVDARLASQAEAEAGSNNTKIMTPLRVQQALDQANASALGKPITGLLLSNNAVTPNTKIDVASGSCRDDTQAVDIILSVGWTKTTASFSAGTGNGAMDTGSIAVSSAYHVFLIYNSTTEAVDILISLSATAPTMPAGFTHKRRLRNGFMTDASGFIRQGVWRADGSFQFKPGHAPTVASNRSLLNASLLSLGLPQGIKMKARALLTCTNAVDGGNPAFYYYFTDPDLGAPAAAETASGYKPIGLFVGLVVEAWTNTSGQVYTYSTNGNDADNTMSVVLQGWTDPLDPFA